MENFIFFIIVAIAGLLIYFAFAYWPITILISAILIGIHLYRKHLESEQRRIKEQESNIRWEKDKKEARSRSERKSLEDAIARQKELYGKLEKLSGDALSYAKRIPQHLEAAEKHLDAAKVDFEDGALSPFWDCIEEAINEVGNSNDCVNNIGYAMSQHTKIKQETGFASASFPLTQSLVTELVVSRSTTDRLNKMVRIAQCSPDFAKIYETKRQSQILIAGFSGLGLALRGISEQIETSIDRLGDRIDGKLDDLSGDFKSAIDQLSSSNREDAEKLKQSIEGLQKEYKITSQAKERQVNDIKSILQNLADRPRPLLTTNERKKDWTGIEWSETTLLTDTGEEITGTGQNRYEAHKHAASKIRKPRQ